MKVTRQAPPGYGFDLVLEFSGLLEEPRAIPAALEEKDRVASAKFYQIAYAIISEPLLRPELTGRPLAQHGAPARATISGA
jgi:hypothetical protein